MVPISRAEKDAQKGRYTMAKKTTSSAMDKMFNLIDEILGVHQHKNDVENKSISMTKASFYTLAEYIEDNEKSGLILTATEDDDMKFKLSKGKTSVEVQIVPQVHDRGETKATQKTYKVMGTSFYDADKKTHTIKVDWNNKLNVYQMWSNVWTKSYHRLEQTPSKEKMWKAYEDFCKKALEDGFTIRKVTEEKAA